MCTAGLSSNWDLLALEAARVAMASANCPLLLSMVAVGSAHLQPGSKGLP